MVETVLPTAKDELSRFLESLPNVPAVFLLWQREGAPYVVRTNVLRRRVSRLLAVRDEPGVRPVAERLEYRVAGSKLESRFLHLELARRYLGDNYRREIRLRLPPYVKLLLANEFPRTQVVTRLSGTRSLYVGPFRSRAAAAQFESAFLDLFQLRRCPDDLRPRADHPGCIYGEMGRCLRPCQQAVGMEEYRSEARRVTEFLRTSGRSLILPTAGERERLSAELDFEGAARMHQRVVKIEEVMGWRDEMARDVEALHGIAVMPSAWPDTVELGWLRRGQWRGFSRLGFDAGEDGRATSLDSRLREMAASVPDEYPRHDTAAIHERMEHLAILSRWYYSTWCDGELLIIDDWDKIPWRKLVNAVSRVAAGRGNPRPSRRS